MEVERINETNHANELNSNHNSNPEPEFEAPIIVGTKVTKYYYNDEPDLFYSEPIVINSRADFDELLDEFLNSKSTITFTKVEDDWDDIPSPPQEDLEAAIQIMDQIQLPDPIVPIPQKTNLPDWD